MGLSIYILWGHKSVFPNYGVFLTLGIIFTVTNSEDPDEMLHYAAFHLRLHCLAEYSFRGFQYTKGKTK